MSKTLLFWIVAVVLAFATLPLGLWAIPILLVYGGVAGTYLGLLDWKEFYENMTSGLPF